MKYTTVNLLTQISNRITNALGKISKTVLGVMLSDMADSTVKLIGDEEINGVKTFNSFPVLPDTTPTGNQALSVDHLEARLQAGLGKNVEILRTSEIQVGTKEIISFNAIGNNCIVNSINVFSCKDNGSGTIIADNITVRLLEKTEQLSGLGVLLREEVELMTVALEYDQNVADLLELYSTTGMIANDLIRIDYDANNNDDADYSTIATVDVRNITLNEPTKSNYVLGNNVRTVKTLGFKGVVDMSDMLNIEVENNSASDCSFGFIINYTII